MEVRGVRHGLLALALFACATAVAGPALAAAKAEHRVRVIRSWPEDVRVGNTTQPGRVEILFDYTAGVSIQRVVLLAKGNAPERELSSKTNLPGHGDPRPSQEEIAEAFETVRADREIAKVMRVTNAILDGGFQIFEPAGMPCGPGSRCIEVQLMTDNRLGFIRNVIVDLTKQAIVYRTYMPTEEAKSK